MPQDCQHIKNMEPSSSAAQPPELSSRYYKAEVACWFCGGILLVCRFIGLAPDQAIPFLNITPADSLGYIRALGALTLAAALYLFVEWKLSESAARQARGRFLRLAVTCIWILATLWAAYPLLAQGTAFADVAPIWFVAFSLSGIFIGMGTSLLIYAAQLIRSREEAERLHLPRIPIPSRINLVLWTPLVMLLLVIFYVLVAFAPPQMHFLATALAGVPFLYFVCDQMACVYLFPGSDGKRLTREERIKNLKNADNFYDYTAYLSERSEGLLKGLDVQPSDSPLQRQEAIRQHFKKADGNAEFHVRQDEESKIRLYAKDGNSENSALNNSGVEIMTTDHGFLRVSVISKDKTAGSKRMRIPTASVESFAEEYLSKQTKIEDTTIHKALSYGMNQTVLKQLVGEIDLPLHSAVNGGESEALEFLLSRDDIDVNEIGGFGWTALQLAAAHGYPTLVKRLLEAGANPDISNVKGMTPLMYAANYGNAEICALVLEYGATVNMQDAIGRTALYYATSAGSVEVVKLLLNHRADPSLKALNKKTALERAYKTKQGEIAKLLKLALQEQL